LEALYATWYATISPLIPKAVGALHEISIEEDEMALQRTEVGGLVGSRKQS